MGVSKIAQFRKIPEFEYSGIHFPGLEIFPYPIRTDMLSSVSKVANSSPLIWRLGFYIIGRNLKWKLCDVEMLPKEAKELGELVYNDVQENRKYLYGTWHNDALLREKDRYIYFREILGFEFKDGLYVPSISDHTFEKEFKHLPDSGIIVPTNDGEFDPETGIPFETVNNEEKAIERYIERFSDLTPTSIKNNLMYFAKPPEKSSEINYHPVCSLSGKGSAFSIITSYRLEDKNTIGYLSATRLKI
jgi:hypothetical protein